MKVVLTAMCHAITQFSHHVSVPKKPLLIDHDVIWPYLAQKNHLHIVQFGHSVVSDSLQPHESQHARPPCPSPTPRKLLIHVYRVSDTIQPSHPLSSPSSPAPNPSRIRVFSNESTVCMRWPKYWSFSISPSSEHPGLISFRMDWLSRKSEVTQSCPTLCDPMDCNLPGSSIHGIFLARILDWVAISFSKSRKAYCNFFLIQSL